MGEDYVSRLSSFGDRTSRALIDIEDATEEFKKGMFKSGVLEKILRNLPEYTLWEGTKSQIKNIKPTPSHFLYISLVLDVGGHFVAGYADDVKHTVFIFDSMCSPCGTHNDYIYFERVFRKMKPGFTMSLVSSNAFYQPSGGLCVSSVDEMENIMKRTLNTTCNSDVVYHMHHFDTMSQHHFCYIETLVFLFHMAYGTPIGPKNDPDKRLVFIKRLDGDFSKHLVGQL
jgi:hypothetical protein